MNYGSFSQAKTAVAAQMMLEKGQFLRSKPCVGWQAAGVALFMFIREDGIIEGFSRKTLFFSETYKNDIELSLSVGLFRYK